MDIESLRQVKTSPWVTARIPGQFLVEPQMLENIKAKNNQQEYLGMTGLLESRDSDITETNARQILENVATGKWKAEWVCLAFIKRASIAYQFTNCITEIMFAKGLMRARELDEIFAKTGKVVGPLHGLPISLKDNMDVQGVDSCMGYPSLCVKPKDKDGYFVERLREMGAIILYKTNTPLMTPASLDCSNPIFGVTTNPANPLLSTGGSSGGEAAMIACRGSVLGIGSDLSGSLRIPASFTPGVYSLKPTSGRLPIAGCSSTTPGQSCIPVTLGPMSTDVEGLEILFPLFVNDPTVAPIPWRTVSPKKYKFAYYTDIGFLQATPPVARAVELTVSSLRARGFEVVEWKPYKPLEALRISTLAFSCAQPTISDLLQGTPTDVLPAATKAYLESCKPGTTEGKDEVQAAMTILGDIPVSSLWKLQASRLQYQTEFWNAFPRDVDGLICPVNSLPGLPLDQVMPTSIETCLYSIVDASCGVLPVTRFNPQLDSTCNHYPRNALEKQVYKMYNDNYSKWNDASIGIQIVGRRWTEEVVLDMMKIIDHSLKTFDKKL